MKKPRVNGYKEMQLFTIVLIMAIVTICPALVIGVVGFAAVRALGRNPSAAPRIFISMILAFVFAEGIAIIALLAVMNLFR